MGNSEKIQALRQLVGAVQPSDRDFWAAPGFASGVAKGIVTELLGNAKAEWMLSLLAMHPEPKVLWVERGDHVNPSRIHQVGVNLERIKFLYVGSDYDLQQPLRLMLESGLYPFIIAPTTFTEVRAFQRIHLLSEKSKSNVFLFADQAFSSAWPISLQLKVDAAPSGFQIEVQRQKHGQEG